MWKYRTNLTALEKKKKKIDPQMIYKVITKEEIREASRIKWIKLLPDDIGNILLGKK